MNYKPYLKDNNTHLLINTTGRIMFLFQMYLQIVLHQLAYMSVEHRRRRPGEANDG
jgi:hypothetical protein